MYAISAALSFFALGVVAFSTAAVFLLAPRNREVRWFVAFNLSVMAWLLGQALLLAELIRGTPLWTTAGIALMPALFVSMAMARDHAGFQARPWAAAGVGIVALVIVMLAEAGVPSLEPWVEPLLTTLHVAGWTAGTVLLLRDERRRPKTARGAAARRIVLGLALLTPLAVVAAQLLATEAILIHVVPALLVLTYLALFTGIARLRFYDIEVRAARSGALAADAAEHARLAALGEMAASFAHEVRNPLTGVRSLAQRLAEDDVDEPRRRRYATVILDEIARIEQIVENLLGLSRRRPAAQDQNEVVPLDALFDDIALLTSARAQRTGVRIVTAGNGLAAGAPRQALAQALLNLVLNAIAHSPPAGVVTLSATRAGDDLLLCVRDQGPGVPPELRERIFEPFYSARPDGAGLGLSVVRRLTRDLNWTVGVDDADGGGAAFHLRVPVAAQVTK